MPGPHGRRRRDEIELGPRIRVLEAADRPPGRSLALCVDQTKRRYSDRLRATRAVSFDRWRRFDRHAVELDPDARTGLSLARHRARINASSCVAS